MSLQKCWRLWLEQHSLQWLQIDKLCSAFPYLSNYYHPPMSVSYYGSGITITNASSNVMQIVCYKHDDIRIKVHGYVLLLWCSIQPTTSSNVQYKSDQHNSNDLDSDNKQTDRATLFTESIMCEYRTTKQEISLYIKVKPKFYKVVCQQSLNADDFASISKREVLDHCLCHNASFNNNTGNQNKSIICFEVANTQTCTLCTFSADGVLTAVTYWDPAYKSVYRRHYPVIDNNSSSLTLVAESSLLQTLYTSVSQLSVSDSLLPSTTDDIYFISYSKSIFHLFDDLNTDLNPWTENLSACRALAKRRQSNLATVRLQTYIKEIISSLRLDRS